MIFVYIKIARLIRNVSDRAYAMSHAAAEASCTQRLTAGHGTDGYQVTAISLQQQHIQWLSTGQVISHHYTQ